MIIFPTDLVPNYIRAYRLPSHHRGEFVPRNALNRRSLLLSNVASNGALELIFNNYPTNGTNRRTVVEADHKGTKCATENLLGWSGAWEFYTEKLRSGHLCFSILPTHKMWTLIDYETMWNKVSLDGLPRIWRMESFTNDNNVHVRQTTDFRIVISQELITPQWQQ